MTEFGTVLGGLCGGRADFSDKDPAYVDDTIRSGQTRLAGLIWIMYILAIVSIFMELVSGYCVGGGAAGVTWSALPHGVWQIPNLIVLTFALQAIYVGVDTDLASTLTSLAVGMWFVLLACLINLVQFIAVCFEINNSNSTFWLQNGGVWVIVLLVGLILFIFWDVLIAWHLFVYRTNLEVAHYQYGWLPSGTKTAQDAGGVPSAGAAPNQARIGTKFSATGAPVLAWSKSTKGQ